MSEWDRIEELKLLLKEKGIVQRERTPVEVMLWAVYDCLIGASLRRASEAHSRLCWMSYETVRKWAQ